MGSAVFDGRAQLLEPLAEAPGREAVVAIVAFDSVTDLGGDGIKGAELEGTLDDAEVGSGGGEVDRPCEAVELCESLIEYFSTLARSECFSTASRRDDS